MNKLEEEKMIRKFWLSNKESCPCGSGKTYGECCKRKPKKVFHNHKETLHFIGKIFKKSKRKICLYEGCSAKPKAIIKAHALQENRILNKLSVNGIVKMQDFTKDPYIYEIKNSKPQFYYFLTDVPISSATIATCYCKKHDDILFAKIEKNQYDLQTLDKEQLFLFAYKTFSFELYTQITAKNFYSLMFKNVPQTTKNPLVIYNYRNCTEKLKDLESYKSDFDQALKSRDFGVLDTVVFEIPYEIEFANYMAISPPFDIEGKNINAYERKTKRLKFIFFTSFPADGKSYILMSALKNDMQYFSEFFDKMRNAPLSLIQYYMNVLIPLYSQNLIISPNLWEKWSEKAQIGVQSAVANHDYRILFAVKCNLQNICKSNQSTNISPDSILFNFFK